MTTYHLERRVPREGERYISYASGDDAPARAYVMTANPLYDGGRRYVLTEDRPRGEHPEAPLIRVNGELYGRTYTTSGTAVVYTSVNDSTNFQYASDITEWEDVYDEVPEREPEREPERPTADVIRITAVTDDWRTKAGPFYAVRDRTDGTYMPPWGGTIRTESITAWDDIPTDEEH